MYQVTKRDGTAAQFEIGKISAAITKAFQALDKQFHPTVIDLLALRVTADFEPKIRDASPRPSRPWTSSSTPPSSTCWPCG